ncbi:MAG: biopolymer transporter ExbD [Candidatus Omnitrophota bacterium]
MPSPGLPVPRFPFLVFLNLLFVLVVLQNLMPRLLPSSGLDVDLPRVISSEPVNKNSPGLILERNGGIYLDGVEGPASSETLEIFLDGLKSRDASVLIKADRRATIGQLTRIWDAAREKGIRQISIATND